MNEQDEIILKMVGFFVIFLLLLMTLFGCQTPTPFETGTEEVKPPMGCVKDRDVDC